MLIVAWEVTSACNLSCDYCRGSATKTPGHGELSTEEALSFIDEISPFSPMMILSGGEPLLRPDIFKLAGHSIEKGMRVALATNGTLLTHEIVDRIANSGISRVSVSLDGASPKTHDMSRGIGTFGQTLEGIEKLKGKIPFQINMTITRKNIHETPDIMDLAEDFGAVALHLFFLVPTGRGREEELIDPIAQEDLLHWLAQDCQQRDLEVKVTCAPQFARIAKDIPSAFKRMGSSCLAGTGFVFISRNGDVFPCGYLPMAAGNIRSQSFAEIWNFAPIFKELRERKLRGKCGSCSYKKVCGGCRARAFAETGDYLESDPLCTFEGIL
jgi:radical SAM protein with 4Fe4S-binding SPASM domain